MVVYYKRRCFQNASGREIFLSDWMRSINSPEESLFDESWRRSEVRCKEFVVVLNYIRITWLPFEENSVSAWTENYARLGNIGFTSSGVQGRSLGAKNTFRVVIFDWWKEEFATPLMKINLRT
ncbi:hypothetical protein OIU74_021721 [Salix koriyanagi]|uniref:Uncharacterized protein n=1 Tax=Salix koriyanagi TaxID=2511006 RepID=A0A9Q1ADX4_9ROSI|nr:hypothetical protein OIU74_021721 [Salix koriyanagi]